MEKIPAEEGGGNSSGRGRFAILYRMIRVSLPEKVTFEPAVREACRELCSGIGNRDYQAPWSEDACMQNNASSLPTVWGWGKD